MTDAFLTQPLQRREALAKMGSLGGGALLGAAIVGCGGSNAVAEPVLHPFGRRFASTDELATYTRLSSLRQQPLMLAHRSGYGPLGGLPENTIDGALDILRTCPAFIEFDVHTSKDGALVVNHDRDLGRSTSGSGLVKDATLAELRRLYLKDVNNVVTQQRMPTLDDYLALTRGGALLWLDIKDAAPASIVAAVRAHAAQSQVVVSAYGLDNLVKYQQLAPELLYFIPKNTSDLPSLDAIFNRIADRRRMIAFGGWYVPNLADWRVCADNDIPAQLELNRGDAGRSPEQLDERLYATAVREGFPIFCTNQYKKVAELLRIQGWPT